MSENNQRDDLDIEEGVEFEFDKFVEDLDRRPTRNLDSKPTPYVSPAAVINDRIGERHSSYKTKWRGR